MIDLKMTTLEIKARHSDTCPKCGAPKSAGDFEPVVCWGECWTGNTGLKYSNVDTETWLKRNCPNLV